MPILESAPPASSPGRMPRPPDILPGDDTHGSSGPLLWNPLTGAPRADSFRKDPSMIQSRHPIRLLSAALLLAFAALAAHASPPALHVISIAQARALPLGTVVTVDGSVTTPSGAFYSSFFDNGFGLQDRSAGIFISQQTDPGVAPRRQARVTGTLQSSAGLLILVPTDPSNVKLHG